jgi:23S rRNA (uracil1939-C5)-methyltransferase
MVIVMFGEDDEPGRTLVMEAIHARFPAIESLLYVVNESKNDSLYPHEVHTWAGRAYINEQCGPNTLRVRAKAFYQTNPEQALRLYELALDMADLRGTELVFDLYCGIGSIALLAAGRAGRVIGVESVPDAVGAARENARINTIVNTEFATGEVESVLPELIAGHGVPDLVICDPPRVGLHPGARRAVLEAAPARIVYISCNPRTQADDLRELAARYRVSAIQPVDMFPQTRHVENVLLLERSV